MTNLIPQLGKYQIVSELGKGGFATVYRATDTTLDREVALKILHPQLLADPIFVRRFTQEARTIAALHHPNIITIYEVTEDKGRLFIAMALAHGPSLSDLIAQRQRIPWSETLALLEPIAEALDYAHQRGVIHRDLKPANILTDGSGLPLITDFGFARLTEENSISLSVSGGIAGTPGYIAPEVWELNAAEVPADIYALGCIAYEMLTGQTLFTGRTPMQAMHAHDKGPQFPQSWADDVPKGTDFVLARALAREPNARFPSAHDFMQALRNLDGVNATSAVVQESPKTVKSLSVGPPRRRVPLWIWFLVSSVGCVLVVGAVLARWNGTNAIIITSVTSVPTTGQAAAILATSAVPTTMTANPSPTMTTVTPTIAQASATTALTPEETASSFPSTPSSTLAPPRAAPTVLVQQTVVLPPAPTTTPSINAAKPTRPSIPTSVAVSARSASSTVTLAVPTPTQSEPAGSITIGKSGKLFQGSAHRGTIASGGACIQGHVTASDGSLFTSFYIQVDNHGQTQKAEHFYDTGNYKICGLGGGEWGVAVYAVNNVPTSPQEQAGHQVRVTLNGKPDEIVYVDFVGRVEVKPATPIPPTQELPTATAQLPTQAPTDTPQPLPPGPYDGLWSGTLSGQTTTGEFHGRFRLEIRNNAVYRISIDGPSCPFETYPHYPEGQSINGNAFSVQGAPFNPKLGADNTISFTVSGRFSSATVALGSIQATQNNGSCISGGQWTAKKQ